MCRKSSQRCTLGVGGPLSPASVVLGANSRVDDTFRGLAPSLTPNLYAYVLCVFVFMCVPQHFVLKQSLATTTTRQWSVAVDVCSRAPSVRVVIGILDFVSSWVVDSVFIRPGTLC